MFVGFYDTFYRLSLLNMKMFELLTKLQYERCKHCHINTHVFMFYSFSKYYNEL